MNKCLCKDKKYHARDILGLGPIFGSKTAYREANPEANPIFNCYLLAKNEKGEME